MKPTYFTHQNAAKVSCIGMLVFVCFATLMPEKLHAQTGTITVINNSGCTVNNSDFVDSGAGFLVEYGISLSYVLVPGLGNILPGETRTVSAPATYYYNCSQHCSYQVTQIASSVYLPTGANLTVFLNRCGVCSPVSMDDLDGAPARNQTPNNPACGMPVWNVSEPYISLWLHDEPLGYQPALGPRISLGLAFKQRESTAGLNPNIFNLGKKWNCSWLSYVWRDSNSNNVVYFPDGGSTTYYGTNDYSTQTILTGNTTNGFILSYSDGQKDFYGFMVTNNSPAFLYAFLSQHMDAQSNKVTLNYSSYTPGFPIVRLQNVVDGDRRTNFIFYTTNVYSANLISRVVDPFGRMASFNYNTNGDLINIVDVMTNSTTIAYDTNDSITNLTTPYGTTSFKLTDSVTNPPNGRSVLITKPDGGHEYYLYQDNAAGIASAQPTNQVPAGLP